MKGGGNVWGGGLEWGDFLFKGIPNKSYKFVLVNCEPQNNNSINSDVQGDPEIPNFSICFKMIEIVVVN